jgi:RecA-family ATPase
VLDCDINDPDAAEEVLDLVRNWFEEKGRVLIRSGRPPRWMVQLRTDKPFKKVVATFRSPNGDLQKIEVLGAGQQTIVDGVHPDTRLPYQWQADAAPFHFPPEDLPEVDETSAAELVQFIEDMLVEKFNYEPIVQGPNGHGEWKPVDVDQRLAAMQFGGGDNGIHATQLSVTASLLGQGIGWNETVATVLRATKDAVAGDPRAAAWDWDEEELGIERMCADWVTKHPELAHVLPDRLRSPFEEKRDQGLEPRIIYLRGTGWHIRTRRGNGPAAEHARERQTRKEQQGDDPVKPLLILRPFVPIDEALVPPREWLYGRHYQRRTVSATVAPGGFGKTSLELVEAVAMATARNLLGEQPAERLRVWYHNGDDNTDEIDRRIIALCKHYGIPQDELVGQTTGNEFPLRVARGYGDLKVDDGLVRAIGDQVATNSIDVVILDPLVTLHSVSEQDNGKMDLVVRLFGTIADAEECGFDLAHHTRKLRADRTEYSGDDARGAGSVHDAVRAMRVLNLMTVEDAQDFGISEHERLQYFRVDRAKANNAPKAQVVWRRFESVLLANGDDVGVVVPWNAPGQGEVTPEAAARERAVDNIFLLLVRKLEAQGRSVGSSKRSDRYAPKVFAKEKEARASKISVVEFEKAMARLFEAGCIWETKIGRVGHELQTIVIATGGD